ncbi:DUF4258 domain-containing protein [Methylobacterium sp. SyP6R]|uniref:DUF4258 domain-containing protein n=1 Tax=Methylobacterium sp. SyP6R TaxID=2718876 RepID=UPI003FA576C7
MAPSQPWKPSDATDAVRTLAKSDRLRITYTSHVRDRLEERGLTTGDARYVLKHGFVYEHPQESTQAGLYKYRVESRSPNSGSRTLCVVVIPDVTSLWMKLVTVMFVDET